MSVCLASMAYCTWKSYKLTVDPWRLFMVLQARPGCFFLDSSLISPQIGRFSFLGADPYLTLKVGDGDPFVKLRAALAKLPRLGHNPGLPFFNGAVGFLAYDAGVNREKTVRRANAGDPAIPQSVFHFYDSVIAVDHKANALYLCAAGRPKDTLEAAKARCRQRIGELASMVARAGNPLPTRTFLRQQQPSRASIAAGMTKRQYCAAVLRAKEYIRQGDIYQVNLSMRFDGRIAAPASQVYESLRLASPSCFGAYFDAGDFQLLSSSPERFLSLRGRRVLTRLMKGTRPRSRSKREDARLKQELLLSAKDKAELMMITDLERNDLGRVCAYSSIGVDHLRSLETYATVYQTTATVRGRLHARYDSIDLLRACFPGGSITGCPKIRAMQIIEELELSRRSFYTGALGYINSNGDMDFNILIRTILKKGHQVFFYSGAGIVADSDPRAEYAEVMVKAKAMMGAVACQ